MIGVAKALRRVKQALQELLAIEERSFAKVVAVAVEKIEGKVNDRYLCDQALDGGAHMHAFLQALEVTVTLGIPSDYLSVQTCLARALRLGKHYKYEIAFADDIIMH